MHVPIAAVLAGSVAATAAKQQREEEQMAGYKQSDLEGWEFKIVRNALGRFSKSANITKVTEEEAAHGWELVEKFDDHRLRFKRRVERRSADHMATSDPYRTSVGFGGAGSRATMLIGLVLVMAGLVSFFLFRY